MIQQWFEGIHLLGIYSRYKVGCWLLEHKGEAAILEMPVDDGIGGYAARDAWIAAKRMGVSVNYLLCTHAHGDHFDDRTQYALQTFCSRAKTHFQAGFKSYNRSPESTVYFDRDQELFLGGEPLHLVHAPKHSLTDTMVIFRGVCCTGDWELGTVRSHQDKNPDPRIRVPLEDKFEGIRRMERFEQEHSYRIHSTFSAHANDRRSDVDFAVLMEATRGT